MVHDEPGGPPEALRAQPRLVAVPRHDQHVGLSRGGHHHPFGPALEFDLVAGEPEPVRGRLEQAVGRGRRLFREPGSGVAATAPEQAGVRAAGRVRPSADVTWRSVNRAPAGARRTAASTAARQVPSQTQIYTERGGLSRPVNVPQPPRTWSPPHSASTPRISAAGTVSNPSLVNSPRSGADPRAWRIRRHSRVASDPV